MQQCYLLSAVTALTPYPSTALASYGDTTISPISGQLQEISNGYATPSTDLSMEFASGTGWSGTPLIAVGVVFVGAALKHAWEWWRQSSRSGVERPREEVDERRNRRPHAAMQWNVPRPTARRQDSLNDAFIAGTVAGYRDALAGRTQGPSPGRALGDLSRLAVQYALSGAAAEQVFSHWECGYRQGLASAEVLADR